MDIELVQGKIRVNEIRHAIESENFHVWEIDLSSKYPGGVDWEFDEDGIRVWVGINPERTLRFDSSAVDDTHVIIPIRGEDNMPWALMSDASRYTWRIVLWKRPVDLR